MRFPMNAVALSGGASQAWSPSTSHLGNTSPRALRTSCLESPPIPWKPSRPVSGLVHLHIHLESSVCGNSSPNIFNSPMPSSWQ